MNHSRMLTTRRRKQKGKKQLARLARQEKKLSEQKAKTARSGT